MPDLPTALAAPADVIVPTIIEPAPDAEERGRLKRRRMSSHSPRRASSPSRGHERRSGSRYREQHHRKHHRAISSSSSASPPGVAQKKKSRRRSDAEPDHTFRGRARNRSLSARRTRSPILEDEGASGEEWGLGKKWRKRSAPPSRQRGEGTGEGGEVRRQRSYPNLYREDRREEGGKGDVLEV